MGVDWVPIAALRKLAQTQQLKILIYYFIVCVGAGWILQGQNQDVD